MGANLPPEIGEVLEKLVKKAAGTETGDWITEYIDFNETEVHGVPILRVNIKDEDMAGLLGKHIGQYSTLQTGPLGGYDDLEKVCDCLTEELDRYLTPYKGKTLLDEALHYYGTDIRKELEAHYGGLAVIAIGQAVRSGQYAGVFVPCKVLLANGKTEKLMLALRNDNPEKCWLVDGGL